MSNHHPLTSPEENGTAPRKRRRAKIACEPCRERKRKCNAQLPCETCIQYEYDCFYDETKKAKPRLSSSVPDQLHDSPQSDRAVPPIVESSKKNDSTTTPNTTTTSSTTIKQPLLDRSHGHEERQLVTSLTNDSNDSNNNNPNIHLQSLEANSGAAFVRRLGLKIDPSNAPRLHLFAWNIGDRLAGCPPGTPKNVTSILSNAEMRHLASVYFDKVAIVYGFIDRDVFFQRLEERWRNPSVNSTYDPVLCLVAALGFLFGQKFPAIVEPDLVETARTLLEKHSRSTPPSIDTVTGWLTLVAYLRMSSLPHTTWLASCSLMHVVEAANIHLESPSNTIFDRSSIEIDVEYRRRLWGMAQHLHIWASFDLGRTKVTIPGASTKPVTLKPGDFTSQLLGFIPLTDELDPNKARTVEDLEADMTRVLAEELEQPCVVLCQVNLLLCIFRRLRAQKSNMLNLQMERILALAMKGVRAAEYLVDTFGPWHHTSNIPFQVVCLLLSIDNRASLSLLGNAMRVLQRVANMWDTPVMREGYNTAYLLILLHQRCKEEDAKTLRDVLGIQPSAPAITSGPTSSAYQLSGSNNNNQYNNNNTGFQQQQPATMATDSAEFLWLEDLIADMPSLREFNLEQFLVQDASQLQDVGVMGGGFGAESLLG
jgi:Fungal Zn(2)-Cys(6) binuclear cluster domain/Fungal specific transcription factor domain